MDYYVSIGGTETLSRSDGTFCSQSQLVVYVIRSYVFFYLDLLHKSTLVISKSIGLFEILRDIRTLTYQIYKIEEKINRITTFHKFMLFDCCSQGYIENIVKKRKNC